MCIQLKTKRTDTKRQRVHTKTFLPSSDHFQTRIIRKKVQVGKDQEKAQSEKDSHSKNRDMKKSKLTIRYLYHENISKAEWAAIFPIGGHSVT